MKSNNNIRSDLFLFKNIQSFAIVFTICIMLLSLSVTFIINYSGEKEVKNAQAQSNERCFSETGYCISGRIREFWEQNGGLAVFGYPITPQREEVIEDQALQVQWFERHRLELHPENEPPYDVLLGRLGEANARSFGIYTGWGGAGPSENPNCQYFEETGRHLCEPFLSYWRANGLELDGQQGSSEVESLALFGLPLTEQLLAEDSQGNQIKVQWFERARFEFHPQNSAPYDVLLGRLGALSLRQNPEQIRVTQFDD
jgi:hypothetical protein